MIVGLYYKNNPEGLLEKIRSFPEKDTEFHLFVDNNDHRISSKFYELRKLRKKGIKLEIYIYPPLKNENEVQDFLNLKLGLDLDEMCSEPI